MQVYSDFDGTIALQDVTDLVLRHFAGEDWEAVERAWVRGDIDARECMAIQIGMIRTDRASLDALLDTVEIDPGFTEFATWCAANALPLTVVSDGVDYFIRRVLDRNGHGDLPVFANHLVFRDGGYALETPWRKGECRTGSGVCKCALVGGSAGPVIYVGDGRSDRCVSASASLLFAKDGLATYCRAQGRPFLSFDTFHDVRAAVAGVVSEASPLPDAPAVNLKRISAESF